MERERNLSAGVGVLLLHARKHLLGMTIGRERSERYPTPSVLSGQDFTGMRMTVGNCSDKCWIRHLVLRTIDHGARCPPRPTNNSHCCPFRLKVRHTSTYYTLTFFDVALGEGRNTHYHVSDREPQPQPKQQPNQPNQVTSPAPPPSTTFPTREKGLWGNSHTVCNPGERSRQRKDIAVSNVLRSFNSALWRTLLLVVHSPVRSDPFACINSRLIRVLTQPPAEINPQGSKDAG